MKIRLFSRITFCSRDRIGCAMLVWIGLNQVVRQTDQTIYQLKLATWRLSSSTTSFTFYCHDSCV